MGLGRWAVYIATTESAIQRFAYDASAAGIVVGSLTFGLIAFSVYVRAHIHGSNKLMLETERRIVDYLRRKWEKSLTAKEKKTGSPNRKQAPDSEQMVESSIYRSDVRDLDSYSVIFTPPVLTKIFSILILLLALANTAYWFRSGEVVIQEQVATLVYDLSVEIETKVNAYLDIPVGLLKSWHCFMAKACCRVDF